jgi:hypothetical protein
VDDDSDTFLTVLYVGIDDATSTRSHLRRWRPKVGICPKKLSDAEVRTLAVLQALSGFTSEARFLRHARVHLARLFPYLPTSLPSQPGGRPTSDPALFACSLGTPSGYCAEGASPPRSEADCHH